MNIKTISLERTTFYLRLARSLQQCLFILPIVVLFYQEKGLTVGDFFFIQGIYALVKFAIEIPTGYIGDLFSRKKVITIGFIFYALGYVIWYLYDGFFFVLLGELFFGINAALYSGTGEAYLYDILKKTGREKKMMKELGKMRTFASLSTAISTFSGAYLYNKLGADGVLLITLGLTILSILIIIFLPDMEDIKRKVEKGKSKFQDIIDIAKYTANHSEIKWLIMFPAIFGSITLLLMWSQQPLMENKNVPIYLFGIFVGLNQFFRTLLSYKSNYLFNKFKIKNYTIGAFSIVILGVLSALLITQIHNLYITYFMLIIVGIAAATVTSIKIVMSTFINHKIKSNERATILSVSSMMCSICSGLMMILSKFLIDNVGLDITFVIIIPIAIIPCYVAMKKLLKLEL